MRIFTKAKKNQQNFFMKPIKIYQYFDVWVLDCKRIYQIQHKPVGFSLAAQLGFLMKEQSVKTEESISTLLCIISKGEVNDQSDTSCSSAYIISRKKYVLICNWKRKKYHKKQDYVQKIKYLGYSVLVSNPDTNFVHSRSAKKIFDPGGASQS